jgi:carboxylesterase
MIIPTAEPFFFPGNNTGCLLVHGITGSPKEMRWMGEYLANEGYSILGIRLAGHATQPEDMMRMHWQDWLASVEDGYYLLKNLVDHIFIIGLSMGGILSLLFSSRFSVTGVVTMSTPYVLPPNPMLPYVKIISLVLPKMKKGPSDRHDKEAEKSHVEYPYIPTKSIIQLQDLLFEMRTSLPKVNVPVLLIHSKQDRSVAPQNVEKIFSAVNSQDKQILYVENSGHDIPREPDRDLVFRTTNEFIIRVQNSTQSV